jgi:hypothetical protein
MNKGSLFLCVFAAGAGAGAAGAVAAAADAAVAALDIDSLDKQCGAFKCSKWRIPGRVHACVCHACICVCVCVCVCVCDACMPHGILHFEHLKAPH